MQATEELKNLLNNGDKKELRALFGFTLKEADDRILWKFNLWGRFFFPKYFSSDDADFHKEIDGGNLAIYRGSMDAFVNIAFRGAAKTARTKLWRAFVLLNDEEHTRRYLKVLCEDGDNSKQIVTDIYNMLVSPRVMALYPETFEKTITKREERMDSFTTFTGVKLVAGTVGTGQRGALQDESRPDEIWYEDFESRTTLRSARKTKAIWENMEEARTGLAKGGGCIYTCNYISEQGNVHTLVVKASKRKILLIVPIIRDGVPTWGVRYSLADIQVMKDTDEDFEGERLCKPSASRDVFFDREMLEKQEIRAPIRVVGGFKIFREYNPSHRYGSGHDVAGGVELDSSTSAFIDFDAGRRAEVVATYANNTIKPSTFGDEINRESDIFGGCIAGIERNNHGHTTIFRCKQLDTNMYFTQAKESKVADQAVSDTIREYGFLTTSISKDTILFALAKAVEDDLIALNDEALIAELKSYTRNDLIDSEKDPRMTTRHFDLLMAVAIAWHMKPHAEYGKQRESLEMIEEEEKLRYPEIGM